MAHPKLPALVSPQQLAAARERQPDIRLLDVRTPSEFSGVRIAGAYNVPLDRLDAHAAELRAVSAPIVLVCRSGARARGAEGVLRQAGVRDLHLLDGGMLAWRANGLPVERVRLTAGRLLRRLVAVAAVVAGVVIVRDQPLLAAVLFFVGLRVGMGQSLLPCAVAGSCATPGADTAATVRACVAGQPLDAARLDPSASPAA